MASFLSRNNPRGSVGLDIDGTFLAAVQVSGDRISQAASMDLPPGIVTDGEISDPGALTEALREFFRARSLPKKVRLGVSNQQIAVRHLELPMVENEQERDAAIRFQAAEAIAMPLEETVIDYQVIGQSHSPEGTPRMQIVVVAARDAMVTGFVEAAREAGLKPEGIDLNAFALVRMLSSASSASSSARVYCHLGGVTNLAIAFGASCLFTRTLWTAPASEDEGIAATLAEEIRLSIDFYMAQPEARAIGDVVLSGARAADRGLPEELSALIGLPVSLADPLGPLDSEDLPADEDPYRHTVAAGLAVGETA